MAIPKKGSRLIVVDGSRYRWRIRQKPSRGQSDYGCNMTFAVEHFDKSGATLVVKMPQAHPMWAGKQTVPVLPCDVEYSIRQAIAKGWKPSKPGKVRIGTVASGRKQSRHPFSPIESLSLSNSPFALSLRTEHLKGFSLWTKYLNKHLR